MRAYVLFRTEPFPKTFPYMRLRILTCDATTLHGLQSFVLFRYRRPARQTLITVACKRVANKLLRASYFTYNITKITESQYLSIALIASKIGAHAKCVSSSHKSECTARIYEAFIVKLIDCLSVNFYMLTVNNIMWRQFFIFRFIVRNFKKSVLFVFLDVMRVTTLN